MRMNASTDSYGSVNRVQRSVKSLGLFAVRVLEGRGAAVSRGKQVVMTRDVAVLW